MKKNRDRVLIIMACILVVIFSISICPVQLQNDTFYTIKIGEYIMQNGISDLNDGTDPFSWHENLPYTFPHWAYDVFVYLIYSMGGFQGIFISTLVLTSILGLSVFHVNRKITKNNLTSFIITIGVMYVLKPFVAARAQLLTFILFVWTVYFIERFLETKKKRYAISLIIIPIIIANCHCAVWPFFFVLFLPYIAEYLISFIPELGTFYRKWRIKVLTKKLKKGKIKKEKIEITGQKVNCLEEKNKIAKFKHEKRKSNPYKIIVERNKNVKWLILIAIICVFTGFLTPLGDTPYTYLYNTLQGNTMKYINEHLPLTLIDNKEFLCAIAVFFIILLFTDTKIRLKDLFMAGGLMYLSFSSRRQVSLFFLIGSVIINKLICKVFDKYDSQGTKNMENKMLTIPGKIITTSVVLILSLYMINPKLHSHLINESLYPVKAADYIVENLNLDDIRLYNEYNYGSYLLFRGIPVFIDSRADLYAPEFNGGKNIFADAINISGINLYYEDKFKEYNFTHIITHKNSKLNMFLTRNDNYKKLYSDDNFYIYERLEDN